MEEDIKHLIDLQFDETKFYNYLIFLVSVYDENKLFDFLDENHIKYSILKIKKYVLLNAKNFYESIVQQKDFPCFMSYQYILRCYSDFSKTIGITTPLEECIYFSKLLHKGYLSKYKQLKYDDKAYDDFYGPYIVATGKGCCRNFAMMLDDYLKIKNINSDILINCLKASDNSILEEVLGNHLCNIVSDDTFDFIYDPTNKEPVFYKNLNTYKSISGYFTYKSRSNITNNYNIVSKKDINEFKASYEESLNKIGNLFDIYKEDLDNIHNNLKYYFNDICEYLEEAKNGYAYVKKKQSERLL